MLIQSPEDYVRKEAAEMVGRLTKYKDRGLNLDAENASEYVNKHGILVDMHQLSEFASPGGVQIPFDSVQEGCLCMSIL